MRRGRRLEREAETAAVMIDLFCRYHHGCGRICPECRKLSDYALNRLAACPFGEHKPTCSRCPVHCYRPAMREAIREVMRYAGPRMILSRPVLALRHLIDALTCVRGFPGAVESRGDHCRTQHKNDGGD